MAVVAVDLLIAVSETSLWTTLATGSLSEIGAALGSAIGEGVLGAIGAKIFGALLAEKSDAPTRKDLERLGDRIVQSMRVLKLEEHKANVSAVASWWGGLLRTVNDMKVAGRLVDYREIQRGILVQYDNGLLPQISILHSILQDNCHFVLDIKPYSAMLNFLLQTSNLYVALAQMQACFAVLRWNENQQVFSIPDSYTKADTHPVGIAILSCRAWIFQYTNEYLSIRDKGFHSRPHPDGIRVWSDSGGDDLIPKWTGDDVGHNLLKDQWMSQWGAKGGLAIATLMKSWESLRQAIQPGVEPLKPLY
ncbi:hypothetical protein QFC22_001546 [Naganishia vaughanmartiniae]|uniref:Uncharacterized protein n=1 Tax=Naganishia vaughanmartiniae TaxID=1424756 RepID=A0ACC2XKW1_9TREE|nr:hypothetical protein QFC22_001546 [Naganishia vaughanmartiniae]